MLSWHNVSRGSPINAPKFEGVTQEEGLMFTE
jgi:hypothetical protein